MFCRAVLLYKRIIGGNAEASPDSRKTGFVDARTSACSRNRRRASGISTAVVIEKSFETPVTADDGQVINYSINEAIIIVNV